MTRFAWHSLLVAGSLSLPAMSLAAQQPITRADAVAAALAHGDRAAMARADTTLVRGALRTARAYPNPSLAATYSKDVPHYHYIAQVPLDFPWLRSPRVGAAKSALDAARQDFAFERLAIAFEAETTYTRALAAAARARLSRRNASDADSLLRMARLRREAGDVSDLEVRLAEVNAGQLENVAAGDSLAALDALLTVQLAMGLEADTPAVALADSLSPPSADPSVDSASVLTLRVAAAAARLTAADRSLALARRGWLPAPSLEFGIERGDPSEPPGTLLPTFGVSLALPLFDWKGGEVAQARALRDRASSSLALERRRSAAEMARARRDLAAALERVARDRRLLASADRMAGMSLEAYAEGAVPLANVLEAQRNAREALARYIDDVALANDAIGLLRLVTAGGS